MTEPLLASWSAAARTISSGLRPCRWSFGGEFVESVGAVLSSPEPLLIAVESTVNYAGKSGRSVKVIFDNARHVGDPVL